MGKRVEISSEADSGFNAMCRAMAEYLDTGHPDWEREQGFGELQQWLRDRWPVPPEALLSAHDWAETFIRQSASRHAS